MTVLDRLVAELMGRVPVAAMDAQRPLAAVALLLAPDPDRLLVIRRAERQDDPWSGHLALPGGRREAADTDLLETAIRETVEETGVRLERAWQRAVLDDHAPTTAVLPPIIVRPFVFQLTEALAAGHSAEVASAAWVPLDEFTAPGVFRETELLVHGSPRRISGYALDEGFLWGMTERIITPVIRRWGELVNAPG